MVRLGAPVDSKTFDLAVVGLGGSGLSAIHAGLERGWTVVGVDAVGVAAGAAGRNGGFLLKGLAPFYHDARTLLGRSLASRLYAATEKHLLRMEAQTPDDVRLVGSLRRAESEPEREDCARHLEALQEDGFQGSWVREPEGTGLLIPGDGVFHPVARCVRLARRAQDRGARLLRARVDALEPGVLRTPTGPVRARRVLVAVDGGLEALLPPTTPSTKEAFGFDPMPVATRLQMLATAPDPVLRTRYAVYSRYGYDYWQQRRDGRILLGGGRDVGGSSERTPSLETTAEVQDYLTEVLRKTLRSPVAVTHRWAGTVSYARRPVFRLEPGCAFVGAYSGTGNVLGSLMAEAAVSCLAGAPSETAHLLREMASADLGEVRAPD